MSTQERQLSAVDERAFRAGYQERWNRAHERAVRAGERGYVEAMPCTLYNKSATYFNEYNRVMQEFYRTEEANGHRCPECGMPTPTGRCAHCQGV